MRISFAILFCAALAACSKPYDPPQADRADTFLGVNQTLENSPTESVQMIFSHGMCSHNHGYRWAVRRANSMARALGASEPAVADGKTYYDANGRKIVESKVATLVTENGRVDATFFIWGRAVDPYRDELEYENYREGEEPDGADYRSPKRAKYNQALRSELINRCFTDAVVYLGRNGDSIRAAMRKATCELLGGSTHTGDQLPPGEPNVRVPCRRDVTLTARAGTYPTILMPESLGSIILMDAFVALDGGREKFVEQRLSNVVSIFLATNQIPLLSLGNAPLVQSALLASGPAASFARFLDSSRTQSGRGRGPIQVVAISDPNDLLSFRLLPKHLGGASSKTDKYDLTNVLVSNDYTYLGLLENPAVAHYGTEGDHVFRIIADGSKGLK
ncbi:hypothetical protein [Minwuia thermotolerans]|uniref:hypothetical protein n=1 Tax=Minwuia thermotolerans TaxID=2056226 RepID=UPI000F63B470|nr:hypothetical protein [Minwuia thermotolerans]